LNHRTTLTLLCTAVASLGLTGTTHALTMDFDHDAMGNVIQAGQFIDEEYASWGVHIQTHNSSRQHDAAIAFDTLNYTGGDRDLRTDSGRYGVGNDQERGMVMIIAEDVVDQNNDGYVDDPDDEGRRPAGYFDFMFDMLIDGGGVVMLDIENQGEPGSVDFYLGGSLLGESINFQALGDNSIERLNWSGFEYDMMRVNLGGSGAVAEVSANPVPEPVSALLVTGAIGALGLRTSGRRSGGRNEDKAAD